MSDHIETFHCRECGGVQFYWHFEGPDGDSLIAKLAVLPDMTSMEAAKAKAIADHERRKGDARCLNVYTESKHDCSASKRGV